MRGLTAEDIGFLCDLRDELNTQDTAGQAGPRFWVLREIVAEPCWDGCCEGYEVISAEDGEPRTIGSSDEPFDKGDVYTVPVREVRRIVRDTLFLTLREAEEHVGKYGYNYSNAYPYAMTAVRSPQVERLWELLQEIDWEAVRDGLMAGLGIETGGEES